MTKRPSLFGKSSAAPAKAEEQSDAGQAKPAGDPVQTAPVAPSAVAPVRYPKASTREGKRVVTAYLAPEAFRQLKRVAADEDQQQQDLLVEAINLLFEKRGLSRIA